MQVGGVTLPSAGAVAWVGVTRVAWMAGVAWPVCFLSNLCAKSGLVLRGLFGYWHARRPGNGLAVVTLSAGCPRMPGTVALGEKERFGKRAALLGLCVLAFAGCVQRRLIVRSNPPGARVIVDDTYEMGVTPVAFNYTYYGTRKIKLVRDGYETLTVYQYIPPPWYQYPGLDFITENLVPWEIRDERVVQFQLVPQAVVPTEQVLRRAEDLRRLTHGGQLPPAPAANAPSGSGVSSPSPVVAPPLPVPGGPTPGAGGAPPATSPGSGAGTAAPVGPAAPGAAPNPYLPPGGFTPPPPAGNR